MRPKTEVGEGVPAYCSPLSLGIIQSRSAGAYAPRILKPAGRDVCKAFT